MLMFYVRELLKYSDNYHVILNMKESLKLIRKLSRHFKINCHVVFDKRKNGSLSLMSNIIHLPKNVKLGLIIHEVAHILSCKKYGKTKHDKKLWKCIKIVNNYIVKNNLLEKVKKW